MKYAAFEIARFSYLFISFPYILFVRLYFSCCTFSSGLLFSFTKNLEISTALQIPNLISVDKDKLLVIYFNIALYVIY